MKQLGFIVGLLFAFSLTPATNAAAEEPKNEFVYNTICEPTEEEDVARVIRGHLWLAMRRDHTVRSHSMYVGIRKTDYEQKWITETDLMQGLGLTFNSTTLDISYGGAALGHGCLANAKLIVDIVVERKDGQIQTNSFTAPIKVPGAYATKQKYIADEDSM